jgi:hypothetical protein
MPPTLKPIIILFGKREEWRWQMETGSVGSPHLIKEGWLNGPPAYLLSQIQNFFRRSGVFGRKLSIEHGENLYRISCNEHAFVVYCVNRYQGLPPGAPGWPVCQVNSTMIFDECRGSGPGGDHSGCGLELRDWLEIVHRYCRDNLTQRPPPSSPPFRSE